MMSSAPPSSGRRASSSGNYSPDPRTTSSSTRTYSRRRPRPNVGDTVLITSSSKLNLNVDPQYSCHHDKEAALNSDDRGAEVLCSDSVQQQDMLSESIRSSKDLPKLRNRIFEDSLESQEVSFYIDDDVEAYYDKLDTQFEIDSLDSFDNEDSDEERYENLVIENQNIENVPLPEPPAEETYGIVRLAKNFRRIKKTISKDLGKSFRRFSQRMSTYIETDVKEPPKEELPAPVALIQPPPSTTTTTFPASTTSTPTTTTSYEPQQQAAGSFLSKLRRSMSLSPDTALTLTNKIGSQSRSTFYLSEPFDADPEPSGQEEQVADVGVDEQQQHRKSTSSTASAGLNSKLKVARPKCPPPPVPVENKAKAPAPVQLRNPPALPPKTKSLYSEAGLFKNNNNYQLRCNNSTSLYAESGLYPKSSNSSASSVKSTYGGGQKVGYASVISELSVKLNEVTLRSINKTNNKVLVNNKNESVNNKRQLEYNNRENESDSGNYNSTEYSYYNSQSVCSSNSNDSKKDDLSFTYTMGQIKFLEDEPLYQFYDADIFKSMCYDDSSDFDSDIYEDIGVVETNEEYIGGTPTPSERLTPPLKPPKPPELPIRSIELNRQSSLPFTRSLWCEVPEVLNSTVLSQLSSHQKKLQEAKFEIITSEASYLNSLNVLQEHFVDKFKSSNIVNEKELDILFGKIRQVRNCSKRILLDLEKCWQKNILLDGICDIVQKHAEENFDVYIPYCENQVLIGETLNGLKDRQDFQNFLVQLEASVSCQFLSLYSFLMLPMQRITRWPLLVDAILKRLAQSDPEYITCQYALASLNKIVNQCNEAARKKEREIELAKIAEKLEYPKMVPFVNIVSSNRWLIRSGCLTWLQSRGSDLKMTTCGKRFNKMPVELFMFNDLLIITKKKNASCYVVLHYCLRSLIELRNIELSPMILKKEAQDKNVIYVAILENHEGHLVELLLSCQSETDKERWIEALAPPKSENPDETVYECWDCPQVVAIHNYTAEQPDELSLARGDVINVLRKMSDGWYNGERLRDSQTGWFPSNYTQEILNPHVRARNIKQRYRLLAYSEHYLKC